eukprot:4512024-Alexandrium_andersonii.AAC.1
MGSPRTPTRTSTATTRRSMRPSSTLSRGSRSPTKGFSPWIHSQSGTATSRRCATCSPLRGRSCGTRRS